MTITDKALAAAIENDYSALRSMPNGELAGVHKYAYTGAVTLGLDEFGFRTRFCYATVAEAEAALKDWDGNGDPPGNWIKQKPEERHGPGSKVPEEFR